MTVFSCRVNGCRRRPDLASREVHILTKKKPRRPAETLREGMMPVVRLSFITMKLKNTPSTVLTTNALQVSCSRHAGTFFASNISSTDVGCSSPASMAIRKRCLCLLYVLIYDRKMSLFEHSYCLIALLGWRLWSNVQKISKFIDWFGEVGI